MFILGCAYADGCFTAEETILAAYFRGKCIQEAQLPAGINLFIYLTEEIYFCFNYLKVVWLPLV